MLPSKAVMLFNASNACIARNTRKLHPGANTNNLWSEKFGFKSEQN